MHSRLRSGSFTQKALIFVLQASFSYLSTLCLLPTSLSTLPPPPLHSPLSVHELLLFHSPTPPPPPPPPFPLSIKYFCFNLFPLPTLCLITTYSLSTPTLPRPSPIPVSLDFTQWSGPVVFWSSFGCHDWNCISRDANSNRTVRRSPIHLAMWQWQQARPSFPLQPPPPPPLTTTTTFQPKVVT